MPAYKEKDRNTWTVKFKHKNWSDETKWVTKRGFATKREALQYERDFLARQSGNLDMSFAAFVNVYREDRGARVKESTLSMKDNIIDAKLVPYFGKKCMREITTKDIMLWQNELLAYRDPKDGKPYSKSYLKTIHIIVGVHISGQQLIPGSLHVKFCRVNSVCIIRLSGVLYIELR